MLAVPCREVAGGVVGPREEPNEMAGWGVVEGAKRGVLVEIKSESGGLSSGVDPWQCMVVQGGDGEEGEAKCPWEVRPAAASVV